MKRLLLLSAVLFLAVSAFGASAVRWDQYPTSTNLDDADTFMFGTTTTNNTIRYDKILLLLDALYMKASANLTNWNGVATNAYIPDWSSNATNASNATNFYGSSISMTGALTAGGASTITNTLAVTGALTVGGASVVTNSLGVTGALNVGGAANLTNTLAVVGALTAGGASFITNTLGVSGAVSIGGLVNGTNGFQVNTQAGINATNDVIVAGDTTNRMVWMGGILVSNIVGYYE